MIFNKRKPSKKKRLTWVFNQTISSVPGLTWSVNAISGKNAILSISAIYRRGEIQVRYTGNGFDIIAFTSGSWLNGEELRIITFETEPTGTLLTWLQANATPQ